MVPYSVRTEMWSDGAVAERWFAVPDTNQLSRLAVTDWETGEEEGDWRFPTNGVLVKTLSLELEPGRPASRRRLETQVLLYDGRVWHPYVYRWNTEGTEAELHPWGASKIRAHRHLRLAGRGHRPRLSLSGRSARSKSRQIVTQCP